MAHEGLGNAKRAKNDEFYTQYADIEAEMNAYLAYDENVFRGKTVLLPCDDPEWSNFTKYFSQRFQDLGIKKLISTSYAPNSKPKGIPYQPTLFELESSSFDQEKTQTRGKIFTLTDDTTGDGRVDFQDLQWSYLEGDGDFRSDEITALRDEADVIITNPPFSLFRDFIVWLVEGKKEFSIIGNMNAITYKEVFPLIKGNKIWLGATNFNRGMYFFVPENFTYSDSYKFERELDGKKINRVPGVCWYSNIEHGRRHEPLRLMTTEENLRFNKAVIEDGYLNYDNYSAIEIPKTDAIPADYDGVMGVPITFLDKYNPDQFEILGATESEGKGFSEGLWDSQSGVAQPVVAGSRVYKRIFIRRKQAAK